MRCSGPLATRDVATLLAMPRLVHLTLEGLEAFPIALCALSKLTVLEINKEGDEGISRLPDEIHRLRSLRVLRLRARRLQTLPDSIADLESLVELDVRHSGVRELPARMEERVRARLIYVWR